MAVDYETPLGQVRLLINDDVEGDPVFSDGALTGFLTLNGDNVKLAAAQALDVIANDEALTSKVIRTQDLSTDGAKLADALRKGAVALREQVEADDYGFEVVDIVGSGCVPELTEYPAYWPWT